MKNNFNNNIVLQFEREQSSLIKECEKCKDLFTPPRDETRFCSRKCANSRKLSDKTKLKISNSLKKIDRQKLSDEQLETKIKKYQQTIKSNLLAADFEKLSIAKKRQRVFIEQDFACANCKLALWMEQAITLELEHKDGNNQNNSRENLLGLCPNCHSLTNTWRGRNKSKSKVEKEILIKSIIDAGSIHKGLLNVGLTPKANNYNRAKNLLKTGREFNSGSYIHTRR